MKTLLQDKNKRLAINFHILIVKKDFIINDNWQENGDRIVKEKIAPIFITLLRRLMEAMFIQSRKREQMDAGNGQRKKWKKKLNEEMW